MYPRSALLDFFYSASPYLRTGAIRRNEPRDTGANGGSTTATGTGSGMVMSVAVATSSLDGLQPQPAAHTIVTLQNALLWLVGAGGAIVFIEPSPYEFAIVLAIIVFAITGLRSRPVFIVPFVLIAIVNAGYSICAAHLFDRPEVINWILTSWYMATTAAFFALVLLDNTAARLQALMRGYLTGAVIAALAGIAGYFHLVPGGYEILTYAMRARGTFKDPNVLGAFLILPALLSLQCVVADHFLKAIRHAVILAIISLAIFLAFSRAAWGLLAGAGIFMLVLMLMTAPTHKMRIRIIVMAAAAIGILAIAIVVVLSMDNIADLFKERASLNQSYDSGRFGRFGRHVLGAEMALDLPLGIGPLQFSKYFPEDTHNSFLNAFMSGGWLSGIGYPLLITFSVAIGFSAILRKTPWQRQYLAIFATFLGTVGESFIIDTDHWRHFFLLLGTIWGLSVASREWRGRQPSQIAIAI